MTVAQPLLKRLSRCFGQRDRVLLDHSGQFAGRTNKTADFDVPLLAIDNMHRKQRASIDLMVEPYIGHAIKKELWADRRIKHSKYSVQNMGRAA